MNTVNVTVRVDKNLKKQAEILFSDLGLNMSSAFNLFLHQAIVEQAIPFRITRKQEKRYPSRSELEEIAEKTYEEHPILYKELAK